MLISFPNMGLNLVAFKTLFTSLDLDVVVPPLFTEVKDSYFCLKFLSLPDVIKILPNIPKILNFEVKPCV
ncbi:MAG: hypothetical protein ACFFA2_12195 [Promethearchaeota archaeon]